MAAIYLKNDLLFITSNKDQTLEDLLTGFALGKIMIKHLINDRIKINGKLVKNKMYLVRCGDIISIDVAYDVDYLPSGKLCQIVYEDELVLIVKKRAGQIIHDDQSDDALDNDVATYFTSKGYRRHIRHIHRLDKETQGLVFFSKLDFFGPYYNQQLAEKKIKREYLAIVKGHFHDCIVDKKIGKDRHVNNKYRLSKSGKTAKTKFTLWKYHNGYSLIHCELFTGRTHQIRVHLQSLGFPIVNDAIYGKADANFQNMGLYAYKLTFFDILKNIMVDVTDDAYDDLNYFKMF